MPDSLETAGVSSIVAAAVKSIPESKYSYWAALKTPSDAGGGYSARSIYNNINLIDDYTKIYFDTSSASKTGETLGNRFFMPTGTTCMVGETQVDRYMFIDNIPTLSTPATGGERGMVPGILKDLEGLNPVALVSVFGNGLPQCSEVTLKTNGQDVSGTETHYMADGDIRKVDACAFEDGKNTKTGALCEGFTTLKGHRVSSLPRDRYLSLYLLMLSLLGFYITIKVLSKKN